MMLALVSPPTLPTPPKPRGIAMSVRTSNITRSEHFGALQKVVDSLYADAESPHHAVRRLDVVIVAEAADLPDDLMEVVRLLPPGSYTRQRLCDQLNSSIGGHAWGQVYGTVE